MDLAISIHRDLKLTMYWPFKVILRDLKQNFRFKAIYELQLPVFNAREFSTLASGLFTSLPSLQETKSLASHPLGKHPQRLFGFQEKENSREKRKTRELYILLSVKHNIYFER